MCVDDVVALDRPLADEQGVTLAVAIDADARDVICDAPRITQVLINLVRNALEAMRGVGAGGTITVGARARQDGRVEVRVEDEGVGLDVPDEGIFRPYLSVNHVWKRDVEWFARVDNLTNVQRFERDNLQVTAGRTMTVGLRIGRN